MAFIYELLIQDSQWMFLDLRDITFWSLSADKRRLESLSEVKKRVVKDKIEAS